MALFEIRQLAFKLMAAVTAFAFVSEIDDDHNWDEGGLDRGK
jgi:hypothetical protein